MSSAVRLLASLFVPLAFLLAVSPAATAAEPLDTFSIRIGGYVSTFGTRLDGDFNFRDSGVRLGVAYRF